MFKKGMIINMNEGIIVELEFFFVSILWGGIIIIIYDCLRVIRKVIKHKEFFVALEDVLYWVVSSLLIFNMMYKQNNGIIRIFSILAMFIGMIIYHNLFSKLLVETISFLLIKIKRLISKVIPLILKPITWLISIFNKTIGKIIRKTVKKLKIVTYNQIKRLKNKVKSSKIPLSDFGEGDLFEEKEKQ